MSELEGQLTAFAAHLIEKARQDTTSIADAVRIFKEVRELYIALTKDDGRSNNNGAGRRPTMNSMREKIALVSGGDDEDEPA
jgi:hypothetical protein